MTQADNLHVITSCVNTRKTSHLGIEILVTLTSSLKHIQFFVDQSLAALSITLASLRTYLATNAETETKNEDTVGFNTLY